MSLDDYFASATRSTFLAGDFIGIVVEPPEIVEDDAPEGYGLTMIADSLGFTPTFGSIRSTSDGDEASRQMLAYATLRRFCVKHGTYIHDSEYGFKLEDLLNKDIPATELPFIEAEIASEASKDERVANADADVSFTILDGLRTLLAKFTIQPLVGESFQFTIAANSVRIRLYQEAQGV